MKTAQTIRLQYYHPQFKIAFSHWRNLYLLKDNNDFELLSVEVYHGQLVYRVKGSHHRITWKQIKKGLLKRETLLYLPF